MRQTLFTIPDQIANIPVFGLGWLLLVWMGTSLCILWYMTRKQGWTQETRGFLPFIGIVAAVIVFVLPRVLIPQHGLPIRGYGVMLLLATIAGVLLALHRARQVGLDGDLILSLAFNMFVGGILGARLFYIIQYWDRIHDADSLPRTLGNMVNFVEGGLVVYGSLIGALAAGLWFLRKHKLPALAVGDLIAPSLALGLAIGRIGCLMNGCCFGGPCHHVWAIEFPDRSPPEMHQTPPYYAQHRSGLLYGFELGASPAGRPLIAQVEPDGAAAGANVRRGAIIGAINGHVVDSLEDAEESLGQAGAEIELDTDQGKFHWSLGELPDRTRPVHPTQLYSSLNAALLSLLTFAFFPYRRRDGEVFLLLMGLYAVTRFLLEIIRTDEGGLWQTGFTISQNVSLLMLVGVVALGFYLSRQPRGSYWASEG